MLNLTEYEEVPINTGKKYCCRYPGPYLLSPSRLLRSLNVVKEEGEMKRTQRIRIGSTGDVPEKRKTHFSMMAGFNQPFALSMVSIT